MDIAAMSMALSQMNIGSQVSMAVMNLGMDQMEQSGPDLVESLKNIELSVNPNVGSKIDIRL